MEVDSDVNSPKVVENSDDSSMKEPKDKLLDILDKMEDHIEQFRRDILILEEKRDSLFTTLDSVRNSELIHDLHETDRDDIQRYVEKLASRCSTVEISVRTDRDSSQEEALFQVNRLIDSLVVDFKNSPAPSRIKCESYMAACSAQPQFAVDERFEVALLGCTLDDQKRIKKRLQGLMDYLDNENRKIVPFPED